VVDNSLIDLLAGGLFGVMASLLGVGLTYYFTVQTRNQQAIEAVVLFGAQLFQGFEDILLHVSDNQDKLARIKAGNWNANPPKTRVELQTILNDALQAFPLPLPEMKRKATDTPFAMQLEYNLALTKQRITELNKKADGLRSTKDPTDEEISEFLALAQDWIDPTVIEDVTVLVAGNMFEAVYLVRGSLFVEWRRRRQQEKMRQSVKEDLEIHKKARQETRNRAAAFEKSLSGIK
jgi:hypothetical protein